MKIRYIILIINVVCVSCVSKKIPKIARIDGYEYVDLGLPSKLKWATYNIGAKCEVDTGLYFSWGEILPKKDYSCETYKWGDIANSAAFSLKYTKYVIVSEKDTNIVLEKSDDAATVNWGKNWRMPTTEEQRELIDNCNWEWTDNYKGTNISGHIGTSKRNYKSIFFPSVGSFLDSTNFDAGEISCYWSSSLGRLGHHDAFILLLRNNENDVLWHYHDRCFGVCVRAVSDKK